MPDAGGLAADSPERWRAVRGALIRHRPALTQVACRLYPAASRVGGTPLLCREEWIPAAPLDLDAVTLNWAGDPPALPVLGTDPACAAVRPLRADGERYRSYADALAELSPPAVFENRPCYRPLAADFAAAAPRLDLTRGRYFDSVSVDESVAHELAAAHQAGRDVMAGHALPFRGLIGDPCDLGRRPAMVAVSTLTLRRSASGDASFLLHWRDPAKVTHAGGLYQVMPVGIFQPADGHPASERSDLSLWHSMTREFSEELLGTSEDYRHLGSPLDYGRWPFHQALAAARASGRLRVWCLGMGVDPLTLAGDILTVAVFDAEVFDSVFGGLVSVNAEGRVLDGGGDSGTRGFPFTAEVIERFGGGAEPVQPAGAAVLRLAWQHRAHLLG